MNEQLKTVPETIVKILEKYKEAQLKRNEYELGFNIFALISETYHKENFHSDIISALLNPIGKHNEGDLFLNLFLQFLQTKFTKQVDAISNNYGANPYVDKEFPIEGQRRIDILIASDTNAIIIENKINDAIDMENQIV